MAFTGQDIVERACGWTDMAIFQGKRLLSLIDSQLENGLDVQKWTDDQYRAFVQANKLARSHLVEEFEGYFFAYALNHARRWARRAQTIDPSVTPAVEAFESATRDVTDFRDMIEHEDEYLAGTGRNQQRYVRTFGRVETTAHTIIAAGERDYLIGGGRINVAHAVSDLENLLSVLERSAARLGS